MNDWIGVIGGLWIPTLIGVPDVTPRPLTARASKALGSVFIGVPRLNLQTSAGGRLAAPLRPETCCPGPVYFSPCLRGVTMMFFAAYQGWTSKRSRPALTAGSLSTSAFASSAEATRKT